MIWIDTQPGLDQMMKTVNRSAVVAIDTEADSLHSYFDKVCLVQLSVPGSDFLVDPLAKLDLEPLGSLLANPSKLKVLHGADYDLRILQRDFGFRISNLIDTMVAAQLAGYDSVGLAALLRKHFNVEVDKSHQRADWAKRPLPPQMLKYAALDTHHLIELAEIMKAELVALNRWDWALEEFARMETIRFRDTDDDPEPWRKLKGLAKLDRRGMAITARLHQWRDTVARELDRPPFKVLGNETILEIATARPRSPDELSKIKGVSSFHLSRWGRKMLALVEEALAIPEEALPAPNAPKAWLRDRNLERRIDKLRKVRDDVARDLRIDPAILAPKHLLTAVASLNLEGPDGLRTIPTMRNWQRQVVGPRLLEALRN